MEKAILFFSNNETLELREYQSITPIVRREKDGEVFASRDKGYELYVHTHDGIIPAILDLFYHCEYFSLTEKTDVVYCVRSVVRIERG